MSVRRFVSLALLGVPLRAGATVYYVSPAGSDSAAGTSEAEPWKSLGRVNAQVLAPGDQVLLEGGQTFTGGLSLDAADAGNTVDPVILDSYGTGRAVIASGSSRGVYVYNTAGVTVRNLTFEGAGAGATSAAGIEFYNDLGGATRLPHVYVEDVEVSGYRHGILVGGWNGSSGFDEVRVSGTSAHDNERSGFSTYTETAQGITNLTVVDSLFFDNAGDAAFAGPSGGGVMLGGVAGATLERNQAYGNGGDGKPGQGAAGFFVTSSTGVVLQDNESWRNRANGTAGGAGYALDAGTTDSVIQYSYTHDNDGSGISLAQGTGSDRWGGNVVRYTVSENDARANGFGAITAGTLGGPFDGCDVVGNTVYISPAAAGTVSAVSLTSGSPGFQFVNNLFVTAGGEPLVRAAAGQTNVRFVGNGYWSSGAPFLVEWEGGAQTALAEWRASAGQETVGGADVGIAADPRLAAPGKGGTVAGGGLATLVAYTLQAASPMLDAGLDPADFGVDAGGRDLYGALAPQGSAYDVGAYEGPVEVVADTGGDTSTEGGEDSSADGVEPGCGCATARPPAWLALGAALVALQRRRQGSRRHTRSDTLVHPASDQSSARTVPLS